MVMSMEDARLYVADGAALLDEKGPQGWRETLRELAACLRVESTDYCPLGVLYGSFSDGVDALGIDNAHQVGFERSIGDWESGEGSATYAELTAAWLDLLA